VKGLREAFEERMADVLAPVARKLHFLDEIGMHLGLTRLYGRATPGERVVEATPGYSGPHYTGVAALTLHGVQAPWVLEGSMDGPAFEAYVQHVLAPTLRRGDIVVLDNLSPHKHAVIRNLIEARGASVEFLPPYSPDFNPIEQCWAKIKAWLRKAKARTFEALLDALAEALRAVSPQDAAAWFAHCGYAVNPKG
jgi:transposase